MIKIKQTFLDSLIGLDTDEAIKLVEKLGLSSKVYKVGTVITLLARGNTVILWTSNGNVVRADAGDPLQVVNK